MNGKVYLRCRQDRHSECLGYCDCRYVFCSTALRDELGEMLSQEGMGL